MGGNKTVQIKIMQCYVLYITIFVEWTDQPALQNSKAAWHCAVEL